MSGDFREVSKSAPCPACGKPDWCAWTPDGWLKCERSAEPPTGMRVVKPLDGGGLFSPVAKGATSSMSRPRTASHAPKATPRLDWNALCAAMSAALTPEDLARIARELGVAPRALGSIGWGLATSADLARLRASGAGWHADYPSIAYACPERDGGGRIVGVGLRAPDGRKGAPSGSVGSRRGLVVPDTLAASPDPVLIVEGATDVAAAVTLGLAAVGRPSNTGGVDDLAQLLHGRTVLVVGERDMKPDGAWPGRNGAKSVAHRLAAKWGSPVPWTLPPEPSKDLRHWLEARISDGLSLEDDSACQAAGRELLSSLSSIAHAENAGDKRSQADAVVELALETYRIGRTGSNEAFAVRRQGPNIAIMLRGGGDALRSELAGEYFRRFAKVPSSSALADAMTALSGLASEATAETVHLRVAAHDDSIVLDLGRSDGRVVVIAAGRWWVTDESPVLFRRTALTGELVEPTAGGDLQGLRKWLNVTSETWPLLTGFLVAALFPNIPHPVLMLGGEQGAGKTTAAKFIVRIFDASSAPVRSPPRDPEQWAIAAANSYGVVIDNVSTISEWWSDALCKAVTGDGWLRRRLYTDCDVSVLSFRRVIALTSIDPGSLRGDLADRLLVVDLERISDTTRMTERQLEEGFARDLPSIFGGLLNVAAAVLGVYRTLQLAGLPRMADFAQVLAAMDHVLGTEALRTFMGQRVRLAGEVIESDGVGAAIATLMAEESEWMGSMKDLLARITPTQPPKGWPRTSKALGGSLRRLAPALRQLGIEVQTPRPTDKTRRYVLRRIAQTARSPDPPSASDSVPLDAVIVRDEPAAAWAVSDPPSINRPSNRPATDAVGASSNGDDRRSGGSGGYSATRNRPTRFADEPCRACGQSRWWRDSGGDGMTTCGGCHPPSPELDIEWLTNQSLQDRVCP